MKASVLFISLIVLAQAALADGSAAAKCALSAISTASQPAYKSEPTAPAILRPGDRLPTIAMKKFFDGETMPGWEPEMDRPEIKYFTPEERKAYAVTFDNGVFKKSDGTVLVDPGHFFNYVMDGNGNFYVFDQVGHEEIRHSSILDSAPVGGAGELIVDSTGHLTAINTNSGHYGQNQECFSNVLSELAKDGVDMTNVKIVHTGGFPWLKKSAS